MLSAYYTPSQQRIYLDVVLQKPKSIVFHMLSLVFRVFFYYWYEAFETLLIWSFFVLKKWLKNQTRLVWYTYQIYFPFVVSSYEPTSSPHNTSYSHDIYMHYQHIKRSVYSEYYHHQYYTITSHQRSSSQLWWCIDRIFWSCRRPST